MPAASPPPAPRRVALGSPRAAALFLAVAGAALAADLLSKHAVFEDLLNDPGLRRQMDAARANHPAGADPKGLLQLFRRDVCPGVRFSLSTNPGVVFGLKAPRWAVNAATVLVVILVLGAFCWSDRGAWPTHVALGLIVAGGLGNLYDRLFSVVQLPAAGLEPIRNHVRDFIDLSQLHYVWVFNVADAWLVIGFAIFLLQGILPSRSARKPAA